MTDMRNLVLDRIELMREYDGGFSSRTMRWSSWWLDPQKGIVFPSKKERNNAIRLQDTTREHFAALSDEIILSTLELIIRQFSKQM